ncbi:hypothetical protein [Vibrio gangliei]|nr:hypothetical protein [Vibrio gangliei]
MTSSMLQDHNIIPNRTVPCCANLYAVNVSWRAWRTSVLKRGQVE